ncbi:hypothetical protein PENSUB_4825 [Penicillium subrubescens]|uniref:Uncharacterized protein n=1 Tax=Penicillium subrubescens TaxID=1316194 RepID=A0A1Q5UBC8_9EURO|nr:hypothetical protein PENSUB_4825 [Penicillium subrubescens]
MTPTPAKMMVRWLRQTSSFNASCSRVRKPLFLHTEPLDAWCLSASTPATSKTGRQRMLFEDCIRIDAASVFCTVAPSEKTKSIEWTEPALDMASLRYHVWRDVAVVIGATRAKSSRPVAPDAFLNWLRLATIDIRRLTCPSSNITTAHGDLILDPQLRGQLYHNGIPLTSFSLRGAFLFAYNFASLATCHDRHRPKSWRAMTRQVRQIWEEALGKQKDTVLPLLVDLLWKRPHSAEVEMIGPRLEPLAWHRIWQYLPAVRVSG